jgi:hypothetical protein
MCQAASHLRNKISHLRDFKKSYKESYNSRGQVGIKEFVALIKLSLNETYSRVRTDLQFSHTRTETCTNLTPTLCNVSVTYNAISNVQANQEWLQVKRNTNFRSKLMLIHWAKADILYRNTQHKSTAIGAVKTSSLSTECTAALQQIQVNLTL